MGKEAFDVTKNILVAVFYTLPTNCVKSSHAPDSHHNAQNRYCLENVSLFYAIAVN